MVLIRDFPCDCENGPRHWISVLVFIMAIVAVIFLMSRNRPERVETKPVEIGVKL